MHRGAIIIIVIIIIIMTKVIVMIIIIMTRVIVMFILIIIIVMFIILWRRRGRLHCLAQCQYEVRVTFLMNMEKIEHDYWLKNKEKGKCPKPDCSWNHLILSLSTNNVSILLFCSPLADASLHIGKKKRLSERQHREQVYTSTTTFYFFFTFYTSLQHFIFSNAGTKSTPVTYLFQI